MTVRARLTFWHSGILILLVSAFAVAAWIFLRQTELARTDKTLREQTEIVDKAMRAAGLNLANVQAADTTRILRAIHDLRARGLRSWIFADDGRLVLSTAMVDEGEGSDEERHVLGDSIDAATLSRAAKLGRARFTTMFAPTSSGGARLLASPLPEGLGSGSVVVSSSLGDIQNLLNRARNAAIMAVLSAIVLSGLAGYLLARNSLAPVAEMSRQADRIGAANLHERIPVRDSRDELGVLATTFNRLLDRVSGALEQQRRFMADASHELRTPVAVMRGEADVSLHGDNHTREEYRGALVVVRDAATRLSRTVNDIFLLARVDASQVPAEPVDVYLDELVADACRSMRSLAGPRGIGLVSDIQQDMRYTGDEQLLQRLIVNLLDNAVKYSADSGIVNIRLVETGEGISFSVSNGGIGIPAEAQAHVFDRFYRADPARSRRESGGSGSGLGLSIARWIAELHGGTLTLTEATAVRTTFTLRLPKESIFRSSDSSTVQVRS